MDIRNSNHPTFVKKQAQQRRTRVALLISFCSVTLIIAYLIPMVSLYQKFRAIPSSPESLQISTAQAMLAIAKSVPGYYYDLLTDDESTPKLSIHIKFKHMLKLVNKRQEALNNGFLTSTDEDFVPALIETESQSLPVKLRLKGDLTDHLSGDKWSFRVHAKGDNALFGMTNFSLQAPYTRGYQAEPIFAELARQCGLLAPRMFFVDVTINGDHIGIMNLEEGFAKELLETQQRKASPILKYEESHFWEAVGLQPQFPQAPFYWADFFNWRLAEIGVFEEKQIVQDPATNAMLQFGGALLNSLAAEKLPPSAVFDSQLFGLYLAMCETFNAGHMALWNNIRFYLNPFTSKIEPIIYNSGVLTSGPLLENISCAGANNEFTARLFADPIIQDAYAKGLATLGQALDSPALLSHYEKALAEYEQSVRKDYPWVPHFSLTRFKENLQRLQQLGLKNLASRMLPIWGNKDNSKVAHELTYPAVAHYSIQKGRLSEHALEVYNLLSTPLEVVDLHINNVGNTAPASQTNLLSTPLTLPANYWGKQDNRFQSHSHSQSIRRLSSLLR